MSNDQDRNDRAAEIAALVAWPDTPIHPEDALNFTEDYDDSDPNERLGFDDQLSAAGISDGTGVDIFIRANGRNIFVT